MENWSAHHIYQKVEPKLGKAAASDLRAYTNKLLRADLPVIFTLRHLAKIVNIDYKILRATVERRREAANYHMFAISKRSGGKRFIHAVSKSLFRTQQFLNSELLQKLKPHQASYAFHKEGGIQKCAAEHCGARWLFQYDLSNFFYDITEANVYSIFLNAGYRPLLAFELARICTTTRLPEDFQYLLREKRQQTFEKTYAFYNDRSGKRGVLPQGAPTSPMLSNMAAVSLDEKLTEFAGNYGFVYTRYADDLTFSSSSDLPEEMSIGDIHRTIIGLIRKSGFRENKKKTRIAGPGAKKIVLGLLVDGDKPRLSKETYKRIDRHLHATLKYGLFEVAEHEKFDSPIGFYNHIAGLIAFVKDVDLERWNLFNEKFQKIPAPMNGC